MNTPLTGWPLWRLDAAGIACCAALAAAVCFLGIEPLRKDHARFLAEREQLESQRMLGARLETARANLQVRLEEARRAQAGGGPRLRPMTDLNQHLARISALAAEHELVIDDLQTGAAVPGILFEAVPIAVAGRATYRSCTAFLSGLRQACPDTSVLSLELVGDTVDPRRPGKFRINLQWRAAPGGSAVRASATTTGAATTAG
jgi:hypothetical protein